MKKDLKVISFRVLLVITFISCIIIGTISELSIAAREGNYRTMSGAVSFIGWTCRGIYTASLMTAFSKFVLQSNISSTRKIIVGLMIVILNVPLMVFMELAVFFPLPALVIISIANLIAFLPVIKFKPNV